MFSENTLRSWNVLAKAPMLGALLISFIPLPVLCGPSRTAGKHHEHVRRKVEYGTASWYGGKSQGHEMACGERFNERALIAAHRTLPLGTKVKVTNLRNGRSVVVKIKDRGPWVGNRLIDLSKAAAGRLGYIHHGLAPVEVRVLTVPKRSRDSSRLVRPSRKLSIREPGIVRRAG